MACHSATSPDTSAGLVLDDQAPMRVEGLHGTVPGTYVRLAEDNEAKVGPIKPVGGQWHYRMQMSRYVYKMQARRSMLIWKVFGRRLDGWQNEDLPTERVPGDAATLEWRGKPLPATKENLRIADLVMPPPAAVAGTYQAPDGRAIRVEPLSDEDRLTLARWIDLGCPIDLDYDPARSERRGYGWACDDARPTLAVAYPKAGRNDSLDRVLVGTYDYDSGIDGRSFTVTADFPLGDPKAGENLAGRLKSVGGGVWEFRLDEPMAARTKGTVTVSVKDRQGNETQVERTFSVGGAEAAPSPRGQ